MFAKNVVKKEVPEFMKEELNKCVRFVSETKSVKIN